VGCKLPLEVPDHSLIRYPHPALRTQGTNRRRRLSLAACSAQVASTAAELTAITYLIFVTGRSDIQIQIDRYLSLVFRDRVGRMINAKLEACLSLFLQRLQGLLSPQHRLG
jgi:hypothetical protein